jgi:hypothetical protein
VRGCFDGRVLTDEQIAAMTDEERQALIRRLARPVDDLEQPRWVLRRMREFRVALMVGSVVVMVPWIVNLAITLPRSYVAQNWDTTWVGFDVLLLLLLLATAVLGWLRRQLLVVTAFATGLLLVCDAWFDVMTAQDRDLSLSVATALAVELPLAVLLIAGSLQLMRLTAARLWVLEEGAHVWQIPIPLPSAADSAVRRQRRRARTARVAP